MTCVGDCRACILPDELQPHGVEIRAADGLFIKEMQIPRAETIVPQHAHVYDHTSLLAVGSIRVWKDGVLDRDYHAPAAIFIAARVKHAFASLEDGTLVYCIHQLHGTADVEIHAEHDLMGAA